MLKNLLTYTTLTTALVLAMAFNVTGQKFPAKPYKDLEGLLSNKMYDVNLMSNHEIWFGTDDGISIYDGLNWTTLPDSIDFLPRYGRMMVKPLQSSGGYVIGILRDQYVLAFYDGKRWEQIPLPQNFLSNDPHFDYLMDNNTKDNGLVLSFRDQVYRYEPGAGWRSLTLKDAQGSLKVHVAEMVGDSLVIGTNRGLYAYDLEKPEYRLVIPEVSVVNFCSDSERARIYLLGKDWLGHVEKEKLHYYFKDRPIGLDIVSHGTSSVFANDQTVYYAYNSTLNAYDLASHTQQMILTETFDRTYWCEDAMIDHENNLWVVTARGGFKIYNRYVYNYDQTQLMEAEVSAIFEASDGSVYLGSNFGFQVLEPSGRITKYPFDESLFQPRVMDIIEFEGVIYLAANSAGVVSFHNGKMSYMDIPSDRKRAIDLEVHDGKLYLSNAYELYQLKNGKWMLIYQVESHDNINSFIRKIFFEGDHKFLLNVNGVFDFNQKKLLTSDSMRGSDVYDAIFYQGQVFVGTKGGLGTVVDDKIQLLNRQQQDPTVFCMMVDDENRFWVGTDKGIICLSDNPQIQLSKENGLAGNEINRNAFIQLKDGRIMVGTDEGLSVLSKGFDKTYPIPKTEIIGEFVNGEPFKGRPLMYDQNNLKFDFRGISFYNESLINYRVKLEGFESEWRSLSAAIQRSISYPNLEPGTYQFHVQSRVGSEGYWSPDISSSIITIKPSFYDTLLFRGLSILILTAIVMGLIHLRYRSLNKRNHLLKKMVAEKTATLNEQNHRLVKMISDLKATQSQLIQSEKLASMGVLTAGIAHEMNNPLNYILGGAACLKKNLEEMDALHHQIESHQNPASKEKLNEFNFLFTESEQLITSIQNGAEKSADIVKSLQSFSNDAKDYYSFVDLKEEIETTLTLLRNQIGFRITIHKKYAETPKIECYPARINQLLVNVLLNATQAIMEKGEITIELKNRESTGIEIQISDTGEGIALKSCDNVFDPFFTTKEHHSGLGLTMVQTIVKDHHGEVRFQSESGVGTTITIQLPIYQTSHPELAVETGSGV